MTIGLPIPFSFQSSNVKDDTPRIEDLLIDCQSPIFSKGLEVQGEEFIYSYEGEVDFTPRIWEQARQDAGDYDLDEVLFVPCDATGDMADKAGKLIKVTGRDGDDIEKHQRPFEPEEYGAWDDPMNWRAFSQRYCRIKASSANIKRTWNFEGRWYYFFWEDRSAPHQRNCGWRWSAKDRSATGERHFNMYLRTCLKANTSSKYDASKDVKGKAYLWGAPTGSKAWTYQFKSVIVRNDYFYFRTHINIPVKYASWTTGAYKYSYMTVVTPADIDGFEIKRRVTAHNPFDGKGYTKAIVDTTETAGVATWTLLNSDDFDSLAFGRIIADSIDIRIEDEDGTLISEINSYIVNNSVDAGSGFSYDTTIVLYTEKTIKSEHIIKITLHGDVVEIGEILGARSIDAGFTKMAFRNSFKDFSPKEQDQWGNWVYLDGVKAHVHTGTVEFPLMRYDQLNRMMLLIGGQKVVVNSSDSKFNEAPDGQYIFDATMMIARFTNISLDSSENKKRIGEIAKYTFSLEEII